jgi:hypothetical protein
MIATSSHPKSPANNNTTKDILITATFHPQTSFANAYSWTRYNNMRCFPTCDVKHQQHHFCGRPIMINVLRKINNNTPTSLDNDDTMNMYVFGEFRQAKSTQRFDVGSTCNIKNLSPTTTTATESTLTSSNEMTENCTNYFPASLADDETTDTSLTFVIHPPRKWKNDVIFSPKMETICLFTVYVINNQLDMCIAVVNSTPFKLERSKSSSSSGAATLPSTTTTTIVKPKFDEQEVSEGEDHDKQQHGTSSSLKDNKKIKSLSSSDNNNNTSSPLQVKRMKKIVDPILPPPPLATNHHNNKLPAINLLLPPSFGSTSSNNSSALTLSLPLLQQWNPPPPNHPSINNDMVSQFYPFTHNSPPQPYFTSSAWFPSLQHQQQQQQQYQQHILLPPTIILSNAPSLLSNLNSPLPHHYQNYLIYHHQPG